MVAFRALALAAALVGLLFVAPSLRSAHAAEEVAPTFTLRDVNNQEVSLESLRGKVVLVNFWATWCVPCMVEMPHLNALYEELKDQGFVVLSVSTDDARTASRVKPLIKSKGYSFPVLLDKETQVIAQYNPQKTLPYTVVVDRTGKVAYRHAGYTEGDEVELKKKVLALLGDSGPTP